MVGILICLASLPMPWYRVRFEPGIAKSALSVFGFAEAAFLVTLGSAALLVARVTAGRRPPLPLHEGTLLALAGAWGAVIVASMILDRPNITIQGLRFDYGLSYGAFVALGGCAALALAGMRLRREDLARDRIEGAASAAAPDPSGASRPRSAR